MVILRQDDTVVENMSYGRHGRYLVQTEASFRVRTSADGTLPEFEGGWVPQVREKYNPPGTPYDLMVAPGRFGAYSGHS